MGWHFSSVTVSDHSCCISLQWRHNGREGVSNHQPHFCSLDRLFRRRSRKTSKLRVIGLCVGNSPVTGELPAQMASNAENVSIWWRHHGYSCILIQHCRAIVIVKHQLFPVLPDPSNWNVSALFTKKISNQHWFRAWISNWQLPA